ncbi:hypothetical protein J6590_063229 [Homalodisca vitripennis]|nr:hypothetical protein J6590_063229 [Homalodisca vitripennis]
MLVVLNILDSIILSFCDTRAIDIYLDARRPDVYRGTRYVNACGVTLPTLFNSGHLFFENSILQEKIAELKEQLRHVIDHTIENDKRLLQYTDEIFVVNSPQSVMTPRASVADFGTQCDLPAICMEEQCVNSRTDINNLRTTVEVLEAELRTLRGTRCGKCGGEDGGSEWTVQRGKGRPLQINNRFAALKTDIQESGNKNKNSKGPKLERRPNTAPRKKAQQPVFKTKASLPFHTVWINGDSHGRNIAELVQSMVTRDTTVEGACRPGAKLQTVNSDATPPPGSCYVLIAGTNDLAAAQQYNIYRHLELCITAKLKTAKVIVLTLPHRHDLPTDHPINKETKLVNAYIEELCARHSGAVVLDFNLIRRGAFTRHGMHLKTKRARSHSWCSAVFASYRHPKTILCWPEVFVGWRNRTSHAAIRDFCRRGQDDKE